MMISYYALGLCKKIDRYQPLIIAVENEKTLVQLISDIRLTIDNVEERLCIEENSKSIKFYKETELIIDPWHVDCNSRQIKTKLYQLLSETTHEQNFTEFLESRSAMYCFLEKLSEHIPYGVSYNMEIDPVAIFKCLDVSINNQEGDITERLVEYIKLLKSLCNIKVIFLVNIKLFLSSEEIKLLYKEARYINLQLILIERTINNQTGLEKKVIIDRDNCIIDI